METKLADIYIARHCTTAWNVEERLQGSRDLPLAEVGIKEAQQNTAMIRSLGIDRIVTSSARRAYETAQIYASALMIPVHGTPRLRELDHGAWEGRRIWDLMTDASCAYAEWLSDPAVVEIPNGSETVRAAQQRITEAIRDVALTFRGETVLVVGHKHISALLVCTLLREPLAAFRSNIVKETLPRLLPPDQVDVLCAGYDRDKIAPGNEFTARLPARES